MYTITSSNVSVYNSYHINIVMLLNFGPKDYLKIWVKKSTNKLIKKDDYIHIKPDDFLIFLLIIIVISGAVIDVCWCSASGWI